MHPLEQTLRDRLCEAPEPKAARFVKLTLGLIVAALVLVGGFNFLVDPHGIYGSPVDLSRPRNVRVAKLELLRHASPPPQALILGSSRVRMIPPTGVRALFGLETFHAGGPKSSPQNWLSITRFVVDELGYPIQIVFLGVDPSSFVDETNYLEHPAGAPELRRHLRHPALSWLRTLVHLWSPRQTKESIGVLRANASAGPQPAFGGQYVWDENGFVTRFRPLDPEEITATAVELHRAHGEIEREHLADFEAFVDFTSSRGIRVVAWMTPETPALAHALERTHYPETIRATRDILRGAESRGLILCEVASLGLQTSDFIDPHHPSLQAGRRVLGRLYECARARGID